MIPKSLYKLNEFMTSLIEKGNASEFEIINMQSMLRNGISEETIKELTKGFVGYLTKGLVTKDIYEFLDVNRSEIAIQYPNIENLLNELKTIYDYYNTDN